MEQNDLAETWLCADFPRGPEAKTPRSQCKGHSSIPGQGTRSHMSQLRILLAASEDLA